MIIEGIKDILELLDDENFTEILYHKKAFDEVLKIKKFKKNIKCTEITNTEYKNLKQTIHSKGIFGIIKNNNFPSFNLKNSKFIIILENIQDPGNFGTIIRTAYLFGVDAIFTSKGSVKLENSKVLRASKGFFNKIPIIENNSIENILQKLKEYKFNIYNADIFGESVYKTNFTKPICIFFGSEGVGISEFIKKESQSITIPLKNVGKSLNVSISLGAIISEVNRQWI